MKKTYKTLIALIIFIIFILETTNAFAITRARIYQYNIVSLVISIIMKIASLILFITYFIKMVKDKKYKDKKLLKWLIIIIIISLGLWFSSEGVKNIGMTFEYVSKPLLY